MSIRDDGAGSFQPALAADMVALPESVILQASVSWEASSEQQQIASNPRSPGPYFPAPRSQQHGGVPAAVAERAQQTSMYGA